MTATIADLTEREVIARISGGLPPAPSWIVVGIGDDAAVVEPERNRLEVLSVDALIEGVHFDRAFTPPEAIGHRALAVNLSDLAAMGATPRLALLSLALPRSLTVEDFDLIVAGLTALADRHRLHVAGGNVSRSPGPLVIDVTVIGTVKRRSTLTRGGARPGDELYVSGTIGAAAAGLQKLKASIAGGQATCDRHLLTDDPAVQRYLRPEPRVRLGSLLGRNRAATACIDLSDGLADGVQQMAEASGVGMTIDADALPIEPAAREWFQSRGADPVAEAVAGGDDYELLVTVRPRTRHRLAAARHDPSTRLTRIGICTTGEALMVRRSAGGAIVEVPLPRPGYSHFR